MMRQGSAGGGSWAGVHVPMISVLSLSLSDYGNVHR